uniref:hypothetical protein n=1 Tax=Psammodictyon constrictum TaxID=515483 RepID=UPI001EF9DF58|nr:hypothetical protein MKU01_pgp098 [Psammodictyon constrictum]ULD16395.1 hypothetical protein [Psammodictyon constrictum]
MENKLQKIKKNQFITESEVESKLDILVKGQINNSQELEAIRKDLQRGFIGLALLNEKLNQKLEIAVSELNAIKQEREEKAAQKEARASRKGLTKRDPMTREIYTPNFNPAKISSFTLLKKRTNFWNSFHTRCPYTRIAVADTKRNRF